MKFTLKHTALSLALAGSFALTGCNFIGDGDPVFQDPEETTISIQGSFVKGRLADAPVQFYTPSGSEIFKSLGVRTTSSGKFEISGLNYETDFGIGSNREFIRLVATADEDSYMICDAKPRCSDTVAYEERIPAADLTGVSLTTFLIFDDSTLQYVIQGNTLTTLAAALLEDNPSLSFDAVQTLIYDIVGLTEDEQKTVNLFKVDLKDGTELDTITDPIVKKLAAFNAGFGRVDQNTGETTLNAKLNNMKTLVKAVANATSASEVQSALDAVATEVGKVQDNAKLLDASLQFEKSKIVFGNNEYTSSGTNTGSGTSQG